MKLNIVAITIHGWQQNTKNLSRIIIRQTMLPLIGLSFSLSSIAAPVYYDETIDGDINLINLEMDVGANIVTGTLGCPAGTITGIECDFDFFSVTLPTMVVIESIELSLVDISGRGYFPGLFGVGVDYGTGDVQYFDTSAGGYLYIPLNISTDQIERLGFNSLRSAEDTNGPFRGSINDYTITVNVAAVPVPAALWLFGSALAGLGWLRRKQVV